MKGPVCPSCAGSGLIAPDPFTDREPWHVYEARMRVRQAEQGVPDSGCAILTRNLRPVPCPDCRPAPD